MILIIWHRKCLEGLAAFPAVSMNSRSNQNDLLEETMLTIDEANEVNFGEIVLSSRVPVWVIFGARWSTPCQALISTLSEVHALLGDLAKLVKVNADESVGLGIWYGVDSLPTLLYFEKGLLCARIVGMSDKKNLLAKMKRIMDGEFDGEGA